MTDQTDGRCIHRVPLDRSCDDCRDWHPIADAMRDPGDRDVEASPVPGISRCECGTTLTVSGRTGGERFCSQACAVGETAAW